MPTTNLSAMPVDLATVGPLEVVTVAAPADAPGRIEAIVAASASRSAKLSAGMTQLLLELPAQAAPNPRALGALFRAKR